MEVAVLGSGVVGRTLAGKISSLGHQVALGTRDVEALMARTDTVMGSDESFGEWHGAHASVSVKTFPEAAANAELIFVATSGTATLDALRSTGAENLEGKILVDVTNPLDFSKGFPPVLSICNDDSLGEQIQRTFPAAKVVKSLNTVGAPLMIAPDSVGAGEHHIFVSGDDASAKDRVADVLREWFGWRNIIDLGDITTSRGTEMYLALWIRMMGSLGTAMFNVAVVR
ncbi:MAG: NADPH-dependent F420 reductase [Actinomycetota bacterium]|nr:NAD(P)-binding domain-containing protein [Actinomycetota bacterium]